MKCLDYRDRVELLLDGALGAAEADAVRAHGAGCAACTAFDADWSEIAPAFRGLPAGPYLPPPAPWSLPPGSAGPVLGILLAAGLGLGAWAWATTAGPAPVEVGAAPSVAPAGPSPVAAPAPVPAPVPVPEPETGDVHFEGRVVGPDGRGREGVRVVTDRSVVTVTDAVGVFRFRGLPEKGWRPLRLEAEGGEVRELVVPHLHPGRFHELEPIVLGKGNELAVTVIDSRGAPLPGVLVRAVPIALHPPHVETSTLAVDRLPGELPGELRGTTDGEGLIRIPLLPPGSWHLHGFAEGRPPSRPVLVRPGATSAAVHLEEGVPFEGVVRDAEGGSPVGGAIVRWLRRSDEGYGRDGRYGGMVVAAADGRFSFPAVPADLLAFLSARPGDAAPCGVLHVDATLVRRAILPVRRTATLAGICLDADTGLPVAGFPLRASVGGSLHLGIPVWQVNATSDSDGRFRIAGLPAETLVNLRNPAGPWWPANEGYAPPHPVERPLTVLLRRGGSVEGRLDTTVPGQEPGEPIAVYAASVPGPGEPSLPHRVGTGRVAADGTFRIEGLPPRRVALALENAPPGPGRTSHRAYLELLGEQRPEGTVFALEPGAALESTARTLPRVESRARSGAPRETRDVRGVVRDTDGRAVGGVRVQAVPGDLGEFLNRGSTLEMFLGAGTAVPVARGGEIGTRIPLGALPEGTPVTLVATSPEHLPSFAVQQGDGEAVEIVLQPGVVLEGRVFGEDGAPAPDILVEAVWEPAPRRGVPPRHPQAVTDGEGRFRIGGLRPDLHRLILGRAPGPVHSSSGHRAGGPPVEVRLPPGGGRLPTAPPLPPLLPRPAGAGEAAIPVRVLDAEGAPLPNASASLHGTMEATHRPVRSVRTDPEGRVLLPVAEPVAGTLRVEGPGGVSAYRDGVLPGARESVVRLGGPATGLFAGRVIDAAGRGREGVLVRAQRSDQEGARWEAEAFLRPGLLSGSHLDPGIHRITRTAADGSFDLGSPPGRWIVLAGEAFGSGPPPGPAVTWTAADPGPLEVPLGEERGRLRFRPAEAGPASFIAVVRCPGALGPGAPVPEHRILAPRPDGGYEVGNLPPGPVEILLRDDDGRERGRLDLPAGPLPPGVLAVPLAR